MPSGIKPSSYYDEFSRAGASLNRARRPFLFRNAITGVGIVGLTVGIFLYTLKAVGTDEFDDVKPARPIEQNKSPVPETQR